MNKVLMFLLGAIFGASVLFFYNSRSIDDSSKLFVEKKSDLAYSETTSSDVSDRGSKDIKSTNPSTAETGILNSENQIVPVLEPYSTQDSSEVHPTVLKLMQEWDEGDRANYWGYLSDAYSLPRQGYTKEMLRHAIYSMQPNMFDKFLFEVTRDQNILDRYLSNMRSIDQLEDESIKLLRTTELKHDLVIRLIEHLSQTGVASFR